MPWALPSRLLNELPTILNFSPLLQRFSTSCIDLFGFILLPATPCLDGWAGNVTNERFQGAEVGTGIRVDRSGRRASTTAMRSRY